MKKVLHPLPGDALRTMSRYRQWPDAFKRCGPALCAFSDKLARVVGPDNLLSYVLKEQQANREGGPDSLLSGCRRHKRSLRYYMALADTGTPPTPSCRFATHTTSCVGHPYRGALNSRVKGATARLASSSPATLSSSNRPTHFDSIYTFPMMGEAP